jgi:putative oxidoreductase
VQTGVSDIKILVMKSLFILIFNTSQDSRSILPRMITGFVFLSEGIQKFLFPLLLGPGRFENIGFANPAFWAYFTGTFEIVCGILLLSGLLTRIASIPLFIIMITAFITTKWPILVEKGLWAMAHEYRTDFAMTFLLVYLFIYGSGRFSLDLKISKSLKK